jgi:hypothetical protein
VQVDYQLPQRFDLSYTGADNKPHRPVMIHRAPFGSMERFIGVLIEHFAGAFPLWLSRCSRGLSQFHEKTKRVTPPKVAQQCEGSWFTVLRHQPRQRKESGRRSATGDFGIS